MRPPIIYAFLLADKVFREMETGKVHVAGTFSQLSSNQFPFYHPQFYVYLCLTDMKPGSVELELDMRYVDTGLKVLTVNQAIQSPGPADVLELNLCFNNIKFENEGTIEIALSCDGTQCATRIIKVSQLSMPPQGGPPPQGE